MLELLKKILGLTNTEFDTVIQAYMDACESDLTSIGVDYDETEPLIRQAVMTYVRAHFEAPGAEPLFHLHRGALLDSYELQKDYLRKCADFATPYTGGEDV